MILLLHPRTVRRARNRRFPLSILTLAAALEGRERYEIVDANLDEHASETLAALARQHEVLFLGVSVMPGPQMVHAIALCQAFRERFPRIPIVWGGYFPSLYPDAALHASYVDILVRGQGEDTLLDLIRALRERTPLRDIPGISFRDEFGLIVHTANRGIRSPGDFPWMPYERLRDAQRYIQPTFLGRRTTVHHASYGCPYRCNFCGVPKLVDGRQKSEAPERTAAVIEHQQRLFGIDAVQFYDNNFFLREDDAAELAHRIAPLHVKWWCEARIDILLRYSDDTLRALRRSGCEMIFFGAESGNARTLAAMNKRLRPEQILDMAARIRHFGIVPEFSFVLGNPRDPTRDTRETIAFIRRIKRLNPRSEIIIQHYVPTPHPDGMYGGVDEQIAFPKSPEEWAEPRWFNFTVRKDPALPWLPRRTQRLIDAFETVLQCRWPTAQDIAMPRWGRALLQSLSAWRYALGVYSRPIELAFAQRLLAQRQPKVESL